MAPATPAAAQHIHRFHDLTVCTISIVVTSGVRVFDVITLDTSKAIQADDLVARVDLFFDTLRRHTKSSSMQFVGLTLRLCIVHSHVQHECAL